LTHVCLSHQDTQTRFFTYNHNEKSDYKKEVIFATFNNFTAEQHTQGFQHLIKNVSNLQAIGFGDFPAVFSIERLKDMCDSQPLFDTLILQDVCNLSYNHIKYILMYNKKITTFNTACLTKQQLVNLLCTKHTNHITHLVFHLHSNVNTATIIQILTNNPQIVSLLCPLCWHVDKDMIVDFIAENKRVMRFEWENTLPGYIYV
jgi:hypothetical protein